MGSILLDTCYLSILILFLKTVVRYWNFRKEGESWSNGSCFCVTYISWVRAVDSFTDTCNRELHTSHTLGCDPSPDPAWTQNTSCTSCSFDFFCKVYNVNIVIFHVSWRRKNITSLNYFRNRITSLNFSLQSHNGRVSIF